MFYKIVCFVVRIVFFFIFDIKIYNAEHFNNSKDPYIICCNHTCILDPVILGIKTKRQINFMAKKELFKNKVLGLVYKGIGAFPVDRAGISLSAIKNSLSLLSEGKVLGIFPEGTRVKGYDESNAKPGVAMIANRAKVKVITAYIDGNYKFRGKINVYFGEEKNYFENITEKCNTEKYTQIGKEILKDIYSLKKDR